ncbi:hypothetical protein DL766_006924 [Monosporascus sp. MC13-8B]|nr:hypothetical protein DL763_005550 [Monosporascus cannonballus]RYP25790.1 hypothetical protein DL766_006924 [Monosporascus sp. MC13-8B]
MYQGHRRSLSKSAPPHLIHELMMAPENKSFFVSNVRFPIMETGTSSLKAQILPLLSEVIFTILLGTSSPAYGTPEPQKGHLTNAYRLSQVLTVALRPANAPAPPWRGANVMLPLLQPPRPVLLLSNHDPSEHKLNKLRENYHKLTQASSLDEQNLDILAASVGVTISNLATREEVKDTYRQIASLPKSDVSEIAFAIDLFLWTAIISRAEAFDLVRGPVKGVYFLYDEALDWAKVSCKAMSLVEAINTPNTCFC